MTFVYVSGSFMIALLRGDIVNKRNVLIHSGGKMGAINADFP